ncbi:MAG: molybdate ABC transporter permease subunit [Gammaproteobacteria bacterium]|nr:molybdate ABC transporter permease subunit [Gammaproteobacteria bacterium]
MLLESDWTALWITFRLAALTTVILMLIGIPLAWWLAFSASRAKVLVEAVVALPLVLPPTVLGFYLLVTLSPEGPVGSMVRSLGGPTLVFSFTGLVVGSVIYSLPFAVQPLQNAFAAMGRVPLEAAATLRAGWWDRLFTVALPLCRRGVLTAITLSFAHTVGEFGVVLMIGGNIPGQTQVVSIAIYEHVESLQYTQAHILSAGLLVFSFLLMLAIYGLNRRFTVKPA